MNVNLTPALEEMVRSKIESGLYNNASEVVREALRLMHDMEIEKQVRIKQLWPEVQLGIEQVERGEVSGKSYSEILDDIKRENGI